MADFERPLGALVNPPLAPTPPLADIEDRARRHRTRRRAGVGGVAGVAAAALVAGLVALVPGDGKTTVHTASPAGSATGSGASLNTTASLSELGLAADAVVLNRFQANGSDWLFVASHGTAGTVCLQVIRAAAGVRPDPTCWNPSAGSVQAVINYQGDAAFAIGIAPAGLSAWPSGQQRMAIVAPPGAAQFGVNFFGYVVPPGIDDFVLQVSDGSTVTVTVRGRVASVDTSRVPPATAPSTTVVTQAPATTVNTPNTQPVVTTPPTTVPPLLGIPKLITVTLGAQNLHKITFESAAASGQQSLAVRFWAGVEPCTVLGKVDVVESADKVTVTLWTGTGNALVLCTALAQYFETIVPLSAPLGARAVVDGAA